MKTFRRIAPALLAGLGLALPMREAHAQLAGVTQRPLPNVLLLVDTFNRWFEPENARAAIRVLQASGCRVHTAQPLVRGRPLCCGRTFLTAGMVEEARAEARRTLEALRPYVEQVAPELLAR